MFELEVLAGELSFCARIYFLLQVATYSAIEKLNMPYSLALNISILSHVSMRRHTDPWKSAIEWFQPTVGYYFPPWMLWQNRGIHVKQTKFCVQRESRQKAFDMSVVIPKLPTTSWSVDNIHNRVLCCKSISINNEMHGSLCNVSNWEGTYQVPFSQASGCVSR